MCNFNTVRFSILNIPGYLFFTGLGVIFASCAFLYLIFKKGYPPITGKYTWIIPAVSTAVFSRIFGCLSGIYAAIGRGETVTLSSAWETGIVFYGGLFGYLLGFEVYRRIKRLDRAARDIAATVIPLFHCFARAGCFCAGCCYGRRWEGPLSVNYTNVSGGQIVTCPRIPVQLLESGFDLMLFGFLLVLLLRDNWREKHITRLYLLLYSVWRFLIEFLRGDELRGVIHGISFSQSISVLIWIGVAAVFVAERVRRFSDRQTTIS